MTTLISQAIYPIPFVILAITGGSALALLGASIAASWPPTDLSRDHAFFLLKIALFAAVFIFLALRPRVVAFENTSRDITVSWGKHLPLVYHRYPADEWVSLEATKYTPVGVMPVGNMMRVYHLAPQWKLEGKTPSGKIVLLGTFPTEADAVAWKSAITSVAK